ncbi:GNAT family N-acetyltransferase [Haloarcula salinisoli]|uniref:GNAT family N-acetyltransferase n=1 Tax=Haloarcula salinisoli TaxID=2487746 RepID=A0A8J7YNJ1_9EURY|nr:N-acetyltransferase [Halomicroarcula salinisoli]MBX0287395.1 GNAT family N-acetyltransferase [Halomicroarcula salinisoli]MBX0305031.1 GNAT family N-acetyltransferase [Halomicroarcula salinisoli]
MIRAAVDADESRLRAIQSAALDDPWPELLAVAIDGPPHVLVLDEGEGPIAYTLTVPDHPVAYVAELAVAPGLQGQGHGSALLSALFEELRTGGFETVRLTARADDERVRSFYGSFGFTVEGDLPDHYDDGGAGVLLVREL